MKTVGFLIRRKGMVGKREGVDDPDKKANEVFPKLAIAFYNRHIKAFHPPHAECIESYEEIYQNDLERIGIPRGGLWIKNVIDATIK